MKIHIYANITEITTEDWQFISAFIFRNDASPFQLKQIISGLLTLPLLFLLCDSLSFSPRSFFLNVSLWDSKLFLPHYVRWFKIIECNGVTFCIEENDLNFSSYNWMFDPSMLRTHIYIHPITKTTTTISKLLIHKKGKLKRRKRKRTSTREVSSKGKQKSLPHFPLPCKAVRNIFKTLRI